jgi:hypothetical protein
MPVKLLRPKLARTPRANQKPKQPGKIAVAVRAESQHNLDYYWKQFAQKAWPEERQFMLAILNEWSNNGGGYDRMGGLDAEVPLYSAVQEQIDGMHALPIDRDDIHEVNKLLLELRTRRQRGEKKEQQLQSEILERWRRDLRASFENFMVNGTPDEHRFLNRVLYEWEFYMDKAEDSRPDFPIGSAAAHEVDGESNFVKVCQQQEPHVRALARMVGTQNWLTEFVLWILAEVDEKGQDAIKPADLIERVTAAAADFHAAAAAVQRFPQLMQAS